MQKTAEIQWDHDFDKTLERAQREGRLVLLDFTAAPM